MSPFGLELPDLKIDSIGPVQRCFLSFPIHSKPDSPHIVLRRKVEVSVRNPLGVIYIILVILTQTSNYMSCFILLLLQSTCKRNLVLIDPYVPCVVQQCESTQYQIAKPLNSNKYNVSKSSKISFITNNVRYLGFYLTYNTCLGTFINIWNSFCIKQYMSYGYEERGKKASQFCQLRAVEIKLQNVKLILQYFYSIFSQCLLLLRKLLRYRQTFGWWSLSLASSVEVNNTKQ